MPKQTPNLFAFMLLTCLVPCAVAAGRTKGGAQAPAAQEAESHQLGGIVTLYALDPLASTFCFADGQYGHVVQQHEVRNRCSDIDFNNYNAGGFTVGIEGARLGAIVELGSAEDLWRRYGYEDGLGKVQGFASLRVAGEHVLIKGRKAQTTQEVAEAVRLFQPGTPLAAAPVRLGSIYLLRLTDRVEPSFQRFAKFKVVAYTPGESVTIRWQVM